MPAPAEKRGGAMVEIADIKDHASRMKRLEQVGWLMHDLKERGTNSHVSRLTNLVDRNKVIGGFF